MTKEIVPPAVTNHASLPEEPEVVQVLNELLETARDGEYGFQASADEAAVPRLQQLFYHRAEQCHEVADELVQLIWHFGGTPIERRTASSRMSGLVSSKGSVGTGVDLSMLEDCERREEVSAARYREALAYDLPPEARRFVERHAQSAQRNHEQIRDLRIELCSRK